MTGIAEKETVTGFKLIVGYLGIFLMMIGVINLLPLVLLIFYPEEVGYAKCFIIPGVFSILVGYLQMFLIKGKKEGRLSGHLDAFLVVMIWVLTILVSAVPFMLLGGYNFTQSVFEMTSGYATTGFTVCDVEALPKLFLFFRSLSQFFGGVGLVLVMTSALSDRYGVNLYNAEGHPDKLVPNLVNSARLFFSMYFFFILIGTVFLTIFGMSVFDALNHSICAVATGGFSTRKDSIAYYLNTPGYNGFGIEYTIIFLMLVGQTNFIVNLFLMKGKFKKVYRHCELLFFAILLATAVPVMALACFQAKIGGNFGGALRISLFQFVSALSCTGFTTATDMTIFPSSFMILFILMMIIGGGQGSTAGGIKQFRVVLMLKSIYWTFRDLFSNQRTVHTNKIHKGTQHLVVTDKDISSNYAFIMVYLLCILLGTLLISSCGFSLRDSLFEFSSALGGVGYSIGVITKNVNPIVLWTAIVGMFIGRLEIFIVFVAIIQGSLSLTKKEIM